MKKILIFLALFVSFFWITAENSFANCTFNSGSSAYENAEECFSTNTTVVKIGDASIEGGFKEKLTGWIDNLAVVLGIFAVWGIVYGWLSLTLSTWDDEKIKKAKDILKWSMLWFVWIVLATTIVTVVINLMYSIWSVAW